MDGLPTDVSSGTHPLVYSSGQSQTLSSQPPSLMVGAGLRTDPGTTNTQQQKQERAAAAGSDPNPSVQPQVGHAGGASAPAVETLSRLTRSSSGQDPCWTGSASFSDRLESVSYTFSVRGSLGPGETPPSEFRTEANERTPLVGAGGSQLWTADDLLGRCYQKMCLFYSCIFRLVIPTAAVLGTSLMMVIVGALNLHDCPGKPHLTICMIAVGAGFLVQSLYVVYLLDACFLDRVTCWRRLTSLDLLDKAAVLLEMAETRRRWLRRSSCSGRRNRSGSQNQSHRRSRSGTVIGGWASAEGGGAASGNGRAGGRGVAEAGDEECPGRRWGRGAENAGGEEGILGRGRPEGLTEADRHVQGEDYDMPLDGPAPSSTSGAGAEEDGGAAFIEDEQQHDVHRMAQGGEGRGAVYGDGDEDKRRETDEERVAVDNVVLQRWIRRYRRRRRWLIVVSVVLHSVDIGVLLLAAVASVQELGRVMEDEPLMGGCDTAVLDTAWVGLALLLCLTATSAFWHCCGMRQPLSSLEWSRCLEEAVRYLDQQSCSARGAAAGEQGGEVEEEEEGRGGRAGE